MRMARFSGVVCEHNPRFGYIDEEFLFNVQIV